LVVRAFWILIVLWNVLISNDEMAVAGEWPDRPVKIVVAYAVGTTIDVVARELAQRFTDTFGQSFYVENRSGGGGNMGTDYVAKATADGYTLLMGSDLQLAVAPNVERDLPFQVTDFSPVSLVAKWYLVLTAYRGLKANNVNEFIALAKNGGPESISYGSLGHGTSHNLIMEQLQHLGGLKLTEVTYRGSTQGLPDLLSGRIQVMLMSALPALSYLRDGKLKALGVGAPTRLTVLPDVPTMAEQGFPEVETASYTFLSAPAGTPPDIISKLQRETARIVLSTDVRDQLLMSGLVPVGSTAEELAARIEKDTAKWAGVLRSMSQH
jgi:tripartite-type tricarboxylate transporter receptor subunit TctC